MNDLNDLLDRAAGVTGPGTADVHADLTRGHRALARTRRRRAAAGLAGVAAFGIVGAVGVEQLRDRPGPAVAHEKKTGTHQETGGVALLSQPLDAGPYSFATTPEGWSVQGVRPQAVTIAPDGGDVDPDPDVFIGKLVIMFDTNPLTGERTTADGRTFYVTGDSGYTTISTPTLPGEQDGVVRVQFPDHAGWSRDTMLQFLSSVRVGAGAEPGVG